MDISGKKITVIGGQRSGMALIRLIVAHQGRAKLSEREGEESLQKEFLLWAGKQGVIFEFHGHTPEFIRDSDLIVISPGVPLSSEPVQWARECGIPVVGEVEFAAQFCQKPIIAVTGSNGKTTVSTLISLVLQQAGYKACLAGNVGIPFSKIVLDLENVDFVVLEVSSFQMESVHSSTQLHPTVNIPGSLAIRGFHPHIAVVLNVSQNHLDRHKDLEEYYEAKRRICINQMKEDFLILNASDSMCRRLATRVSSRVVYFNNPEDQGGAANPNHLAVSAVGQVLGIEDAVIRSVFASFRGVEHRLETVRSLDGIDFINDSKATTAQSACWALDRIDRPVVMICGGRDKNIDFTVAAGHVGKKVKKMFVIGESREKICQAFGGVTHVEVCDGLREAVLKARESADSGDCVLLCPMCTSFDMFKDYEDRGRVFKDLVNHLGAKKESTAL